MMHPPRGTRTAATLAATLAVALLSALPALPAIAQHRGQDAGRDRRGHEHGAFRGDIRRFDHGYWRSGHWWHGERGGRLGWWWVLGPSWYWYAQPVYPYPEPYLPPGAVPGFWYWCDAYRQYYPYVGACPSGWRAVPPR